LTGSPFLAALGGGLCVMGACVAPLLSLPPSALVECVEWLVQGSDVGRAAMTVPGAGAIGQQVGLLPREVRTHGPGGDVDVGGCRVRVWKSGQGGEMRCPSSEHWLGFFSFDEEMCARVRAGSSEAFCTEWRLSGGAVSLYDGPLAPGR